MAPPNPFQLDIQIIDRDPFAVLRLEGSIAGSTVYDLKHECNRLIEYEKRTHVVLDLFKVKFIDSGGIGVLAHACQQCKQVGGRLAAVKPGEEKALSTLYQVSLGKMIDFYDELTTAIEESCARKGIQPPPGLLQELGGKAKLSAEERIEALEARVADLEAAMEMMTRQTAC